MTRAVRSVAETTEACVLFPLVPLEEWCKLHDLAIRRRRCFSCTKTLETTIPFADQYGYGLVSPQCQCGCAGSISTRSLRDDKFAGLVGRVGMKGLL